MMNRVYSDQFCNKLDQSLNDQMSAKAPGNLRIVGWRYFLSEQEVTSIGLHENRIGGPYAAPSINKKLTGHIHIIWHDGSHTHASLDRSIDTDFDQWLVLFRQASFVDPDQPGILAPREYPQVNLWDGNIARLPVEKHFELIEGSTQRLKDDGIGTIDGGTNSSIGWQRIRNSAGLDIYYPVSGCSFGFYADNTFGKSYGKRRLATDSEKNHVISTVGKMTARLKEPSTVSLPSGKMPILLMPDVTALFLSQYIQNNLAGGAVVEGHSAFTCDDFRAKRQILSESLSVYIEPLRNHEYGSAPCTVEGIPSKRLAVIKDGCLQTPLLNRKYANKANMEPTPAGPLLIPRQGKLEDLVEGIDRGIMVLSVLGLHAQDTASGSYSVTADQALVIERGQLKGKIKATIAGNLFAQLSSPDFAFGFDEFSDHPGLRIMADVTVEKH
jgi:PmbA protein